VSAICGVVGLDGRAWTRGDLTGVIGALAPLGPDGGGSWDGDSGRCGVAVGALLRHATLEDVAEIQPAQTRDGSLVLVADLRVDNRDELAPLLGLREDVSTPDSVFVLAAYERWGAECLGRIRGDFALALVDRRRGGVLLARDHVGARPLVIHERRGVCAFASTALALTSFDGVGHRLDVQRAAELLALAYVSERTVVDGIRWVPPATAVWIGEGGTRRWNWWRPDPHGIVDLGSAAAHERELREAFDRAVGARLRSTGSIGAAVSGGLDSSSSAATAARLLAPARLPTYTSAPPPDWEGGERPGWDADESPLVLKLAELHPNMVPGFVHLPRTASILAFQEPLWELGAGPVRNPCNALWWHALVRRAAADGVTTLLSGGFGNLCFSADGPDWLTALLRAGRLSTVFEEAAAWSRTANVPLYQTLSRHLLYASLPGPARRLARAAARRVEVRDEWLATTALRPEVAAEIGLTELVPHLNVWSRPNPRETALWVVQAGASQADIFGALAALTGVEERDPTVDIGVLEVAMRQPEWWRRHDGANRAVARGGMADRLPPEIVRRTRRGEQLPDWLDVLSAARTELVAELDAVEDHSVSRSLIDTARLRRLMDDWPARTVRTSPAVIRNYRHALPRALFVSRYLRWFDQHAASVTSLAA